MLKYENKCVKSYGKAYVKKYARQHMTNNMQDMTNAVDIAMSNTNMTNMTKYMT